MSKVDKRKPRIAYPDTLEVEGNKGGSYIRISRQGMPEGMIELEVGETCVITVRTEISVVALAAILTWAKQEGFQSIIDKYCSMSPGTPSISLDKDL